jgi:hypothetical protein
MNFPKTHHLSAGPPAVATADVIIGMELTDFWAVVNSFTDNGDHGIGINRTRIKPETKLISINSVDLNTKAKLPGLPALPGRRCCDGGGRGNHAAVADRGGEGRDPERPQGRDREARRGGERRRTPKRASAPGRPRRWPGTQARSAPRVS